MQIYFKPTKPITTTSKGITVGDHQHSPPSTTTSAPTTVTTTERPMTMPPPTPSPYTTTIITTKPPTWRPSSSTSTTSGGDVTRPSAATDYSTSPQAASNRPLLETNDILEVLNRDTLSGAKGFGKSRLA